MKADFLRHEYTWSDQSIDGKLGLGVISSSTPKNQTLLRQMEKLSGMAEADDESGVDVERLFYEKEVGFVKLTVKPAPAGTDQRQNKKVFLYHVEDPDCMDPSIYMIPTGCWKEEEGRYLPPISLIEEWDSARDILWRYHLMDRLPEFLRAVFWCVFRGSKNLALIVDWNRQEYAAQSRQIMYAIHSLLPKGLRKNAGYASFGCGSNNRSSFYFIDEVRKGDSYDLRTQEYRNGVSADHLDQFFYDNLATLYWEREEVFQEFMDIIDEILKGKEIHKNVLKDIQWIFLTFCLQKSISLPDLSQVMTYFPQLFYRAGESGLMNEVQESLLAYYHSKDWNDESLKSYFEILSGGISQKGEEKILHEMQWVLSQYPKKDMKNELKELGKKNPVLYTKLMVYNCEQEDSVGHQEYLAGQENLDAMESYLNQFDPKGLNPGISDLCFDRSIELLNDTPFDVNGYKVVSRLADILDHKKEWISLLRDFLGQLDEKKEEMDEEQLSTACKIEKIYVKLSGEKDIQPMRAEKERREKKELVVIEEEYYEEESDRHFLPFLIRGIPYGFLTGCILYLLNLGFIIGHWKISIGVGGMWLILMLNYANGRIEGKKKDGYRMWQALGLCIFEGYVIQAIAWLFLPKNVIVYFFIVLGIITVLTQVIYGLLLLKKRYEEEE